jgi:hypothetical protein
VQVEPFASAAGLGIRFVRIRRIVLGESSGTVEGHEPLATRAQRSAMGVPVAELRSGLAWLAGARASRRVGRRFRPHDRAVTVQTGVPERSRAASARTAAAAEADDTTAGRIRSAHVDEGSATAGARERNVARVNAAPVRRTPAGRRNTMAVFAMSRVSSPSREAARTH